MPDGTGQISRDFSNNAQATSGHQNVLKNVHAAMPTIFVSCVCMTLFIGWRLRDYELITPGHGLGLGFGILGTTMMALLLLYSMRKRVKSLRSIGNIRVWFSIHMILGILGPVAILYHANFHLGSLNSNVALISMLIVSGSGIIGRYIYRRIHHGLYGEKANLRDLQKNFDEQKAGMTAALGVIPGVKETLSIFTENILNPPSGFLQSSVRLLTIRLQAALTAEKIHKMTEAYIKMSTAEQHFGNAEKVQIRKIIQRKTWSFIWQSLKVAEFNFYERLFSFWHMLHLPLVYILAFAIIVHVIAVNRY